MEKRFHRAYWLSPMKTHKPCFPVAAAGACLAAFVLSLSAETPREPVTRDNDKTPGALPGPAAFIHASGVAVQLCTYDPDKPYDRDLNKPGQPAGIEDYSDTNNRSPSASTDPTLRSDQRLMQKAAATNAYELAISRQAFAQATHPEVRAFAEMMVRDHERMDRELTALAARKGITVVRDDPRLQDDVLDLARKTGVDYDQAYLEEMIDGHEDAIKTMEKTAQSRDPDVAAFAVQYLPALNEHLSRARQLEALLG